MKFLLEAASLAEVKQAMEWELVDGVVVSPILLQELEAICEAAEGIVCVPTMATKAAELVRCGRELAGAHEDVVVRVRYSREGIKAVKALTEDGIPCEVVLSGCEPMHALFAARAGAEIVTVNADVVGESAERAALSIRELMDAYGYETQTMLAGAQGAPQAMAAAQAGVDLCGLSLSALRLLSDPEEAEPWNGVARSDGSRTSAVSAAAARK